MTTILGQKMQSSLTSTKTEHYKKMLKQLINNIEFGKQQYGIINTALSAGDNQLLESMNLFNKCILKLKNQDETSKKEKLSEKVVIEILKIALNKQSKDQMQKNFKVIYGKYFQSSVFLNQVISLIKEIKNKGVIFDGIFNKLKQQTNLVLNIEQLPSQIEKLTEKIQYYEKIIAQISQFPKATAKVPTLFNNKKDIFSPKIQKQIQNIYLINNVLYKVSQQLNPFKVRSTYQQPKQLKDALTQEIYNPMNMLLKNENSGPTPEKFQTFQFQCIQSPKECQKCSIIQAKWKQMKTLLTMNRQKKDLMNLQWNETLFQPYQKHNIKQLLSTLKQNHQFTRRIPIFIKKIKQIAFKNKQTYQAKTYKSQSMMDELQSDLDLVLSVCEHISQLTYEQKLITKPMQLSQKQYLSNQQTKRKLQEQLERIKNKCIKQMEQCQKLKCQEGRIPMISFQTIQQMFQKLIEMKNKKTQQYSIEKNKLYISLQQLSQKKENMQSQYKYNMLKQKMATQKQTKQLLKDWNLQKQEMIQCKLKVRNLQTQKQRLLESLNNTTNDYIHQKTQNDVLNQQLKNLKQQLAKYQPSTVLNLQSFTEDQQILQPVKEYDIKIDQLEYIPRTRSLQLEEADRMIKQLTAKFQSQIQELKLTKQNDKKIIQQRFNLKLQQTNDLYNLNHEETLKYYHHELKKKDQQQELNKQKDKETIMQLSIKNQLLQASIQEKEALIKDQLKQRLTGLQNNMSEIQQQNKDLINQKNLCQLRIKELSDQVINLKQQLNKVVLKNGLQSISIQQLQKNLQEKVTQLQNKQTIISQHLKYIKILNLKNNKYLEENQMLTNDKAMLEMEKQIEVDKQTSFRIQCQQKFTKLQHEISLNQSKITQKQGQIQEKKLQIERLTTILNQRKIQLDSQHNKFLVLERQHDDMKEIHKKQCQKLKDQLQKQQKNTEISVKDLQKRLLSMADQKDRLQINNFSIQDKHESQMKRIKEEILKLQNVNKELQVMASKGRLNQGQIMQKVKAQAMKEVCEVVLKEKRQLFSKNSHLFGKEYSVMDLNLMNLYYFDGLFQGESLQDKVEYKIRLCQHIRKLLKGTNILRTKLLYKCDLKNKTNIHEYIDGKSNLLLVVRTSGNVCIAGYYSGVYHDGKMVDPGLLISLNNNQSYILNTADNTGAKKKQTELTFKAMQYDKFYVIFGNAEMRIKNGEKKILSNFGVSSAFYNSRGKKRQDFLGIQDKQTEVQTYEFYEVELDQNEEKKEIRQVTERHKQQPRRQQEERRQQQQNINSTRK